MQARQAEHGVVDDYLHPAVGEPLRPEFLLLR